ncbi:hypothetical protein LTR37_011089 [Vermiconidia calcicola]|uniref:Uncharacterized protein n=1 Tax=Vermiconidia calcicola TaxID=1690605 RepID=A0ACC3N4B1_9PEZI|nr:hypothetical protein LTR37_011089 [Vermiconidia calcicola]
MIGVCPAHPELRIRPSQSLASQTSNDSSVARAESSTKLLHTQSQQEQSSNDDADQANHGHAPKGPRARPFSRIRYAYISQQSLISDQFTLSRVPDS